MDKLMYGVSTVNFGKDNITIIEIKLATPI